MPLHRPAMSTLGLKVLGVILTSCSDDRGFATLPEGRQAGQGLRAHRGRDVQKGWCEHIHKLGPSCWRLLMQRVIPVFTSLTFFPFLWSEILFLFLQAHGLESVLQEGGRRAFPSLSGLIVSPRATPMTIAEYLSLGALCHLSAQSRRHKLFSCWEEGGHQHWTPSYHLDL